MHVVPSCADGLRLYNEVCARLCVCVPEARDCDSPLTRR